MFNFEGWRWEKKKIILYYSKWFNTYHVCFHFKIFMYVIPKFKYFKRTKLYGIYSMANGWSNRILKILAKPVPLTPLWVSRGEADWDPRAASPRPPITCEPALVDALQDRSHSEKGESHVEVPVLGGRDPHVKTVHPEILLCSRDAQLSQITVPQTCGDRAILGSQWPPLPWGHKNLNSENHFLPWKLAFHPVQRVRSLFQGLFLPQVAGIQAWGY